MNSKTIQILGFAAFVFFAYPAAADWQPDATDKLQVKTAAAIEKIRDKVPASAPYFDDAYAYAVWPGIGRIAVGFGGALGKGVLIERDAAVGTVRYFQFSSGIQAGAKSFALIVFFKDAETLASLKRNEWQFAGQAGLDIGTFGVAGTPAYNEGVALFPVTNFGIMAEFSASGVKYRFKPYDENSD